MTSNEKGPTGPLGSIRPWWRRRRFLILGGIMFLIIVGLAVGLGVGLTEGRRGHRCHDGRACPSYGDPSTPTTTSSATPPVGTGTVVDGLWQPDTGATWQYQLSAAVDPPTTDGIAIWDIDLFDNEPSTIADIQNQGSRVICYFSGGSYENWRPDEGDFDQNDIGSDLAGWEGENWIDIRSERVRQIMVRRLELAAQKGCDGVDPDNVDGYNNENGLGLTTGDTVNYMRFLADEAHARNLSIGLKNALEVVPELLPSMQWSVNEQCLEYDECHLLQPFIEDQKPVFHVEYPKGDTDNSQRVSGDTYSSICDASSTDGFSTIIKNMNLDDFTESCPTTPSRRR
jgi:endo-alpha-1,4-polygalactosaminidase (GH114 family)